MQTERFWGIVRILVGLFVAVIGYGMYLSPELNWVGFIKTCSSIVYGVISQINLFIVDPFAALGFVLLLVGFFLTVEGFKKMILGGKKKLWNRGERQDTYT